MSLLIFYKPRTPDASHIGSAFTPFLPPRFQERSENCSTNKKNGVADLMERQLNFVQKNGKRVLLTINQHSW
jgi:altronate dehydratase